MLLKKNGTEKWTPENVGNSKILTIADHAVRWKAVVPVKKVSGEAFLDKTKVLRGL